MDIWPKEGGGADADDMSIYLVVCLSVSSGV